MYRNLFLIEKYEFYKKDIGKVSNLSKERTLREVCTLYLLFLL